MPPRKNIVRSGNAGNSSKASKASPAPEASGKGSVAGSGAPSQQTEKKLPLFPPGSKTPLALLNERCQKNGWERPTVEPRRISGGTFTCVITLRRNNKKTSEIESVRMEPHPPLAKATADEAKHWGAVYALYRFANNIQLQYVLPPEPRKYWAELADEHKKAAEHLAWQYSTDPFEARKIVSERQEAARKRRGEDEKLEAEAEAHGGPSVGTAKEIRAAGREFEKAPEARMASGLREFVETAIKQSIDLYPGALAGDGAETPDPELSIDVELLRQQLGALGFRGRPITQVTELLTRPPPHSPYLASLLALPVLDAAVSHLLMTINEMDLPKTFLAGKYNASTGGMISSLHSGDGKEDLKTRWIRERAVKEGGWPEIAVRDCMAICDATKTWSSLHEALGRKLCGLDISASLFEDVLDADPETDDLRNEEMEAVKAVYPEASSEESEGVTTLSVAIEDSPLVFHLVYSQDNPYPFPGNGLRLPPMFLSSISSPPYMRLHALRRLLLALRDNADPLRHVWDSGSGIVFAAVEFLSTAWIELQASPPDVGEVMAHLLPAAAATVRPVEHPISRPPGVVTPVTRAKAAAKDSRSHQAVAEAWNKIKVQGNYRDMLSQRSILPAWASREFIVDTIEKNRVVIVVGETGCGKTTQLPQFILDHLIETSRGKDASILVTQPRRVSALGVAARVSAERLDDGSVGYTIRGDSKHGSRTKLLFVTTGVALRRLATDKQRSLPGVTHIVVDEVHERSVDGDFLLLELKDLIQRSPTPKIILMSATINQQTFVDYFGGAPVIEIPGFTHPVEDFYLEDVIKMVDYRPTSNRTPSKAEEERLKLVRERYRNVGLDDVAVRAVESISRSDRVDYELIAAIVSRIVSQSEDERDALLIFMPGVQEISTTMEALRSASELNGKIEALPLHANLTNDEQRRVFKPTLKRKVVVATNIAETSITIPDVAYVIDSGKVKETSYNVGSGLSKLTEQWITKASGRQRRGRAGRTRPGKCFKLFTRHQEATFSDFPTPEILRVPLDSISLQVKAAREDQEVKPFLQRAIDPPEVSAIDEAWKKLQELGAVDSDGRLSALGRYMALLPLDLRLSKMLVLAAIFRCYNPILTVAAVLSAKPMFFSPQDKRDEAKRARLRFSIGNSDLLTDANAYEQCFKLKTSSRAAQRQFCEENFVSASTVREIVTLRAEFHSALANIGFVPLSTQPDARELNSHSSNENLLKAIICGGLWPRVTKVSNPRQVFDRVQAGTVERDHEAREYKVFEKEERVFIHPQSVLFDTVGSLKSPFLAYFSKFATSKVFLRDATEVPIYGILLFGGEVSVHHIAGGLKVGGNEGWIKLKAWPRIGVLVNQLRRLLDAQMTEALEQTVITESSGTDPVINAMLSLLERDGLTM